MYYFNNKDYLNYLIFQSMHILIKLYSTCHDVTAWKSTGLSSEEI